MDVFCKFLDGWVCFLGEICFFIFFGLLIDIFLKLEIMVFMKNVDVVVVGGGIVGLVMVYYVF